MLGQWAGGRRRARCDLDGGDVTSVCQRDAGFDDNLSCSDDGTRSVSHVAEPTSTVISRDGPITRLAVGASTWSRRSIRLSRSGLTSPATVGWRTADVVTMTCGSIRPMELWPDEYEALRAELRDGVAALGDSMQNIPDPTRSIEARVAEQRAIIRALMPGTGAGADETIAGVPCRLYRPDTDPAGVYLHFHGGGMMLGDPSMNDLDNRQLADDHRVVVVSVDYRLAPEHPYPAGVDDGVTVARWLLDHAADELGSSVLLTGGESAGAYLAAAVLLRLRDDHAAAARFSGANLVFGVYDWGGNPSQQGRRPSEAADVLTPEGIAFFTELYLPGRTPEQRRSPEVSPAHADLTALPPALMTVGTADHLLDDTLTLATRWAAYGNEVDLHVIPDGPHGFQMFTDTELVRRHHRRLASWFDARLAGG